jgi:hypothetical protein
MSRMRQILFGALGAMVLAFAEPADAASTNSPSSAIMPPAPVCPVKFFRELLAMSPAERIGALTNRPPEARARINAKVREYLALSPDERELRLRATELRWWLTPLFTVAPADRATRLNQVPEDLRGVISARLVQWDALPATLQKEFLQNEKTLHYFASGSKTNATTAEQEKLSAQFNQFFDLTDDEKKSALGTLSDAERAAMEKTLKQFESLPPSQRSRAIRNYAKFAGMPGSERAEFLKSAERWAQMSPKERQTWRDLVAHVNIMPPPGPAVVPANLMPPSLTKPPKPTRANMATN